MWCSKIIWNDKKILKIKLWMIALYFLRLRGGDEPDEFEMFQNGPFHGLAGYPR